MRKHHFRSFNGKRYRFEGSSTNRSIAEKEATKLTKKTKNRFRIVKSKIRQSSWREKKYGKGRTYVRKGQNIYHLFVSRVKKRKPRHRTRRTRTPRLSWEDVVGFDLHALGI